MVAVTKTLRTTTSERGKGGIECIEITKGMQTRHRAKLFEHPPEAVSWLIKTYKELASLMGFEVVGRITLRDRKTKREWR